MSDTPLASEEEQNWAMICRLPALAGYIHQRISTRQ
jgi:uncharacterized Tic20 family protein